MLIDKYTLALQAHVITPLMFVEFVLGEDYKYKNELVDYITKNLKEQQGMTGFEDESEEDHDEEGKDDE